MTWFLAAEHNITIYLPHSPITLFAMTFIGLYVVFKVVTGLIKLIPFL